MSAAGGRGRGRPRRARLVFGAVVLALAAVGIAFGCGLDVPGLGGDSEAGARDGALDDRTPPNGEAGPDGDNFVDATVARCEDVCPDSGKCNAGTCEFKCTGSADASCPTGVTCPAGVPCKVDCVDNDTCHGPIDCTKASSCDILCQGDRSCARVACAGKTCKVVCNDTDSCGEGGVSCTATDRCDIQCTGAGSTNCSSVECRSSACDVYCKSPKACAGGVLAVADDASIRCADDNCDAGITCRAKACRLDCKNGACSGGSCCEAGTCTFVNDAVQTCP